MKALNDGNFACGIFVDFQKAFDTVNHSIVLSKLCHYGIRGLANKWFESYLANRKQFVSMALNQVLQVLHVVCHKDLFWDPYFFLYTLMFYL